MIGRIRGELLEAEGSLALILVGGVGYEVQLPAAIFAQLPPPGGAVDLRIRQVFREDSVTLYGFLEPFQRRLFDLLLGVTGCGPKVALALIGQLGEDAVASAILAQDPRALQRASGVGAKIAERIVLELKEKMQEEALFRRIEAAGVRPKPAPADELVAALIALGYRRSEADSAAAEAREAASDVQEQIRHALKILQK